MEKNTVEGPECRLVGVLLKIGVYEERSVGNSWCYKFQPVGSNIIITQNANREVAAKEMYSKLVEHYFVKAHPYVACF